MARLSHMRDEPRKGVQWVQSSQLNATEAPSITPASPNYMHNTPAFRHITQEEYPQFGMKNQRHLRSKMHSLWRQSVTKKGGSGHLRQQRYYHHFPLKPEFQKLASNKRLRRDTQMIMVAIPSKIVLHCRNQADQWCRVPVMGLSKLTTSQQLGHVKCICKEELKSYPGHSIPYGPQTPWPGLWSVSAGKVSSNGLLRFTVCSRFVQRGKL